MIWIVDAHGYGKRFVVRADEMLTAFVELQRAIHEFAVSLILQWPCRNGAAEKLTAFLKPGSEPSGERQEATSANPGAVRPMPA